MAATIVKDSATLGNFRVIVATVTFDAAEDNIALGLSYVHHFQIGLMSSTTGTALPHAAKNVDSSGTAANGTIGISGVTSGDVFCIVAYGR